MKKIIFAIIILAAILTLIIFLFPNDGTGKPDEIIQHRYDLEVEVRNPDRVVYNPYSDITVMSNNSLEIEDGENSTINFIDNVDNKRYYLLRVTNIPNGESKRTIKVVDEFDQEFSIELNFDRDAAVLPPGFDSIDPWEDSELILIPSIRTLVDRDQRLAEDYEPEKLVDLNKEFGIFTLNDAMLESDAAFNLNRMWNDLGEETGDYITVVSGYRSWLTQFELYAGYIKQFGEEETNTFSARPGHSEHQLGTTVDLSNEEVNYQLSEDFGDTQAGEWLEANSHKYGFIASYPKTSQDETGFYEPWQYRYVGIDTARQIHDLGENLYDFLAGNR